MIYPAVRVVDLIQSMRNVNLEPKRLRMVHSFADAKASLVLVEAVKGGRSGNRHSHRSLFIGRESNTRPKLRRCWQEGRRYISFFGAAVSSL